MHLRRTFFFFFFNDTATTEIYTLSLHDALPICRECTRKSPWIVLLKRWFRYSEIWGMDMAKDFNKPLSTRELQKATVATMDILKALVLKNQFGRICARAGWTIEMVFHDGDSLAVRERAWKVIDLFIEVVGSEKLAIWWGLAPVAMAKIGRASGREKG